MDITNKTSQPVIVEAERGGGGGPPDPPFRYKLMKKKDKHFDPNLEGGAIRVGPDKTGQFPEVNGNADLILYAFQTLDGYAGCRLAMKGDATGPGVYTLKRNGNSYEIV